MKEAGGWIVTSVDGSDALTNIERLQFNDTHVALDIDGGAGSVARILGALFGTAALANKAYACIGLSMLDGGMKELDLAALAVATGAFAQLAGGRSNAQFVELVYRIDGGMHQAEQSAVLEGADQVSRAWPIPFT